MVGEPCRLRLPYIMCAEEQVLAPATQTIWSPSAHTSDRGRSLARLPWLTVCFRYGRVAESTGMARR